MPYPYFWFSLSLIEKETLWPVACFNADSSPLYKIKWQKSEKYEYFWQTRLNEASYVNKIIRYSNTQETFLRLMLLKGLI